MWSDLCILLYPRVYSSACSPCCCRVSLQLPIGTCAPTFPSSSIILAAHSHCLLAESLHHPISLPPSVLLIKLLLCTFKHFKIPYTHLCRSLASSNDSLLAPLSIASVRGSLVGAVASSVLAWDPLGAVLGMSHVCTLTGIAQEKFREVVLFLEIFSKTYWKVLKNKQLALS